MSFAAASLVALGLQGSSTVIVNNVRIEALSDHLIRIESKGPKGFEDRKTFNVVDRDWPGAAIKEEVDSAGSHIDIGPFQVFVPLTASLGHSLEGVTVWNADKKPIYKFGKEVPKFDGLPSPGRIPAVFALADSPRVVPGPAGATPYDGPDDGWDIHNQAQDVYLWLGNRKGYTGLRQEVLKLTGPVPLVPRNFFGLWNSRYYPYHEQEALDVIDHYRRDGFPLDMFVVDTDWRVGASHGYTVNTDCFPDMPRFLKEAHAKGVDTMFNDHPEPQAPSAFDKKEMDYRYDNLTKVLSYGNDYWWYDRNWFVSFHDPVPGFMHEIWGMAVYHDTMERYRPEVRPVMMSNVPGTDNGIKNFAAPISTHRYPIWWTGDTTANWTYLRNGVAHAVDLGVESLLPYVSEDLTGHVGRPTPEFYARFLEYGALSPVMRLHCTAGQTRYPWEYGDEAEGIAREYVHLRYRLLPILYSAAYRSNVDGTPIVRRLDVEFPAMKDAPKNEYMLGDDLLVAPVEDPIQAEGPLPDRMFHGADGSQGLDAEYFSNTKLEGAPILKRHESKFGFTQEDGGHVGPQVPSDNWSARWTGTLGPVPADGEYTFAFTADDGVKVWLGDKQIVDGWKPQPPTEYTAKVTLKKGESRPIRIEFNQLGGGAELHAAWHLPGDPTKTTVDRQITVPSGHWTDAWTGKVIEGPTKIVESCPLWMTPMFIRSGAIVVTGKDVEVNSKEQKMGNYVVDAYPSQGLSADRTVYEDDGKSDGYLTGSHDLVTLHLSRKGSRTALQIGAPVGAFDCGPHSYTVRIHIPAGASPGSVSVDGNPVAASVIEPATPNGNWKAQMPLQGAGSASPNERVIELTVGPDQASHEIVLLSR